MRILVTGAHGFLGHHVAVALRSAGHDVIGTDRVRNAKSDKRARVEALAKAGGVKFREVDLASFGAVRKLVAELKPRAIVHIAAQYSVPYTTENMHRYVQSNLMAFTFVFEAAALAGVKRIVYASSTAINDKRRPSGLYGASKAYGEECAHAYSYRKKLETVGLRYGVIYGQRMRRDAEMFRTVRAFCRGESIKPTSELGKNTAFIDVRDAAAIARASVEATLPDRCLVLPAQADEERASYAYIAKLCEKLTGTPARLPAGLKVPPRSGRIDQAIVRDSIGFVPSITLEDGVRHYLDWAMKEARR